MKIKLFFIFMLVSFFLINNVLAAQYTLVSSVMGSGGSFGSSANYELVSSFGQSTPIGFSSSANYKLSAGFLATDTPILPTPQRIPVVNGQWNLFSYSVNKCFYDTQELPTGMLPNCEFIHVDSIELSEPLQSIGGKFDMVIGADTKGIYVFNPKLAGYNTLRYLAPGYGYWVKMKAPVNEAPISHIEITGPAINPDSSLPLKEGWTLAGFWPRNTIYHSSEICPKDNSVPFPENVNNCVKVDDMSFVWGNINSKYERIISFDINGEHTFVPNTPLLTSLEYMGTGYGYWIKMGEVASLAYPDGVQ